MAEEYRMYMQVAKLIGATTAAIFGLDAQIAYATAETAIDNNFQY